ncbi:MAG: DUF1877 family protein [Blastocatellia bacterium]|nr:DUF1877 family protein [Blastocatellia bacterium]
MGSELHFQAIPENCRLLARARRDPRFGSFLESLSAFASIINDPSISKADDPVFSDFVNEARALVEENPWIEERSLRLGNNWNTIHLLLSEHGRTAGGNGQGDWVERAMKGGDEIHADAKTAAGHPIRYLSPPEVAEISNQISAILPDEIVRNWRPEVIEGAEINVPGAIKPGEQVHTLTTDLGKLQAFYSTVHKFGEGVLTLVL